MGTVPSASIKTILKHYTIKQNDPLINYKEFCEYMKRYAQKYVNEQPDLIPFISSNNAALSKEIDMLESEKQILIINKGTDKKAIVVIPFFINKFAIRYQEILNNPAIPFPMVSDLPKYITEDIFEPKSSSEFIFEQLEKQELNDKHLYGITFPNGLQTMLFPSSVKIDDLLEIAVAKIRFMLKQEEYHDYFLKKIKISNPGKELTAKTFFTQVVTKPAEAMESLRNAGETFYFWGQLCYFVKQDYEKVKEYTHEDISKLQSANIIEMATSFYKSKAQKDLQKNTALKNLDLILNKPPYFFTMTTIENFTDSKHVPLLGQYSQQDLSDWLHQQTTALDKNNLPKLLVFKDSNNQRYFIMKNKVIPLIVRLCSEIRDAIKEKLTTEWYTALKNFTNLPEMKDPHAFEVCLEQKVQIMAPVLYALLTSNFLSLVHYETRNSKEPSAENVNLFVNGKLIPYSELLMLSQQEITTDAKIMLPFWYSIPILSWIIGLFTRKPAKKAKTQSQKPQQEKSAEIFEKKEKKAQPQSKKDELKKAARKIEKELIPADSNLEGELKKTNTEWNRQLTKQSRDQLTEDVNCLIRDYMRKVFRTLKSSTFDTVRIRNLAETLAKSDFLARIKDKEPLLNYIQLYIIKIIKTL